MEATVGSGSKSGASQWISLFHRESKRIQAPHQGGNELQHLLLEVGQSLTARELQTAPYSTWARGRRRSSSCSSGAALSDHFHGVWSECFKHKSDREACSVCEPPCWQHTRGVGLYPGTSGINLFLHEAPKCFTPQLPLGSPTSRKNSLCGRGIASSNLVFSPY